MNLLQQGAAWLGDQLNNSAGVPVTYTRAGVDSVLTGVVAQHEYNIDDQNAGLLTSIIMYDWTFVAAELVLTPRKGDRITANGHTFEVLPIATRPCYEWLDISGILLTVHTKRIT
jgi:hypothetical protein